MRGEMILSSIWKVNIVKANEKWSDEDVKYLIENYHIKSASEIADHLYVDIKSVYNKKWWLVKNGLIAKKHAYKKWSDDDLAFLKENYGKMTASKIGKSIGRSVGSITAKASRLGFRVIDDE